MRLKNHFDISRFWLLLKLELFRSRKGILITLVITFGLLFFMDLLLSTFLEMKKVTHDHSGGYASTLIIGGFILTSLAFGDLGNNLKRYSYLTLPASPFEKFFCMWLLTSIGWIVVYTIDYTLYAFVANMVGGMLFSLVRFVPFDPLGPAALLSMKFYFVLQGIFLVGAVHFKGYVLPKTLFALVLFTLFSGVIAYFFLTDVMDAETEECLSQPDFLSGSATHGFWQIVVWIFWWLFAPITWVLAYTGMKDKEA